jgi:hypothetical protein
MSRAAPPAIKSLLPEKVAYWYFRLNGFFQMENFVVHPARRGSQRTDADLLAVRFPYRAERLFDNPYDIMADDDKGLALSGDLIDIVIAEVKTNQCCSLNGPWTDYGEQNVHRALAAVGCLPHDQIDAAAADIYRAGFHNSKTMRIRLVAVGRDECENLAATYPEVQQLLWPDMLAFIWRRFESFRHQKTQVDQWDAEGRKLKRLAHEHRRSCDNFIERTLALMGVKNGE